MDYQHAREKIEDGDVIEVRTVHGLFGFFTQLFTGVYTHTGMAVWLDGGLWMVEINGGKNHAIPLSQLEGEDFDVYLPPAELSRSDLRRFALESLRVKVPYGLPATVAIGLLEFLHIDAFVHWRKVIVCSGYVVRLLELAGWTEHSYIMSPTKFSKLLKLKLEVRK